MATLSMPVLTHDSLSRLVPEPANPDMSFPDILCMMRGTEEYLSTVKTNIIDPTRRHLDTVAAAAESRGEFMDDLSKALILNTSQGYDKYFAKYTDKYRLSREALSVNRELIRGMDAHAVYRAMADGAHYEIMYTGLLSSLHHLIMALESYANLPDISVSPKKNIAIPGYNYFTRDMSALAGYASEILALEAKILVPEKDRLEFNRGGLRDRSYDKHTHAVIDPYEQTFREPGEKITRFAFERDLDGDHLYRDTITLADCLRQKECQDTYNGLLEILDRYRAFIRPSQKIFK